jgi:hypothetical protein
LIDLGYATTLEGHYSLTKQGDLLYDTGKFKQQIQDVQDIRIWTKDSAYFAKLAFQIAVATMIMTCAFEIIHTLSNGKTCNPDEGNGNKTEQHFIEIPRK